LSLARRSSTATRFSSDKIRYAMNTPNSLARRRSQARPVAVPQGTRVSSDNPLVAFLAFLADDTKVGERTARQYVAHLQRFVAWLAEHYQAPLLDATTRDLRQYKTKLNERQKPASVNAALAAVRRFYTWAAETERIIRNPAAHLTDVAAQPLAPKGFSDVERRRLVRQAEHDGPMADAIVTLLLNTGLRVDELVTLTATARARTRPPRDTGAEAPTGTLARTAAPSPAA